MDLVISAVHGRHGATIRDPDPKEGPFVTKIIDLIDLDASSVPQVTFSLLDIGKGKVNIAYR